jgi:hypothetical protein
VSNEAERSDQPVKVHLIRYYGLYSSRTKGIWSDMPDIVRLAPEGFSKKQEEQDTDEVTDNTELQDVKGGAKRSA